MQVSKPLFSGRISRVTNLSVATLLWTFIKNYVELLLVDISPSLVGNDMCSWIECLKSSS